MQRSVAVEHVSAGGLLRRAVAAALVSLILDNMPYYKRLKDCTRVRLEDRGIEVREENGGLVFVCKACTDAAPSNKRKALHHPSKALTHAKTHKGQGMCSHFGHLSACAMSLLSRVGWLCTRPTQVQVQFVFQRSGCAGAAAAGSNDRSPDRGLAVDDDNAEEELTPPQATSDEELALPDAAALDDLVDMLDDQHGEAAGAEADAEAGATLDAMYASANDEPSDDDAAAAASAPPHSETDSHHESDEIDEGVADAAAHLACAAPMAATFPHQVAQARPARRGSVAHSLQHLLEPVAPGYMSVLGSAYALGAHKLSKRCTNDSLEEVIAYQKYVLVSPGAPNLCPSSVYHFKRILGCRGAAAYKFHWCPGYKCGYRYRPEVDGSVNPAETCPCCGEDRYKVWLAPRVLGRQTANLCRWAWRARLNQH
jgi:hypothetical protein